MGLILFRKKKKILFGTIETIMYSNFKITNKLYILLDMEDVYYTSTKSWRGYIFTSVCLCICVSVSEMFSCEQNSSQTDEPI